ncbi:MAG TPA: histidine kinase dimerization/phosphoacceptor domain -containing protein [Caulobacteraceae bacterium]|jgi:two-component sensor histidine kinase|nr:histidine kinase dimerization/phosphoacceptor domain -containing protein [Caulobacteraceae bacterium]
MPAQKPQVNLATENEILRQHQRVLINLARDASDPVGLPTYLDSVARRVAAALEIDHVKILRYRPESDDLLVEAGIGWRAGVVKVATFGTDLASPPGYAFQTGQSAMITDVGDADGFRISPVLKAHGIVSLVNVPILIDSAVWGVLEGDSSVLRGFSEDTLSFMTAAAALVTLVIRRTEAEAAQALAIAAHATQVGQREVLLREMQHRVKNNFQTILSMINMRRVRVPTEQGRTQLRQIEDAIMAMALAHGQLAPTQSGEVVGLAAYLRALVRHFERSIENVGFALTLDELDVSIEQAVPVGLIVNELITNAVKHAFGSEGGTITVQLRSSATPEGKAILAVSDNGKGIDEQLPPGSGRTLIRALADQARGRLEHETSPTGTTMRLVFFPRAVSLLD